MADGRCEVRLTRRYVEASPAEVWAALTDLDRWLAPPQGVAVAHVEPERRPAASLLARSSAARRSRCVADALPRVLAEPPRRARHRNPATKEEKLMQAIIPYLLYKDCAAALDWLSRAFGFEEVLRYTGEEGYVN